LAVEQAVEQEIVYQRGPQREIEHGIAVCQSCAARFPIEEYVLSFSERLESSVRADGAFWGTFYSQHYDQGFKGFMDTTQEPVPFLTQGVPTSIPFDGDEWAGIHVQLAQHRWVRQGGRVVDVGVGAGWSSLFLARHGFDVIAFEPALELTKLAKRHAISTGVFVEYICSDMANFRMRPETVDMVFALHSLHHIPDIEDAVGQIHSMLRVGGCLALDDHLQDAMVQALLRDSLIREADATIFPAYRNEQAALALPSHHSENEGVGMGQVLQTVERYMYVDDVRYRHICFDILGPIAYLKFNRSKEALAYATELVDFVYQAMRKSLPDQVEYMTLVAQKRERRPDGPVFSPPPVDRLSADMEQSKIYELELKRLHAIVTEKNAHIQRLERLLGRIENGRLMRLLRLFARG
jgi:2-polyprenyl-3-methyl-5-hydroxy-6-metoxy-1,4-benzoquinol methylase